MTEEPTFDTTLEKIKSRGYREVWIRPSEYIDTRIESLNKCHEIIRESRVELRGWDFPHLSNRSPPYNKLNYIEAYNDWDMYKEIWRYYQDGQFIHLTGVKEDWFDSETGIFGKSRWSDTPPGTIFGYINWLFSITEIYEFAARLAQSGNLGSEFRLSVTLNGMENRKLISFNRDFWMRGDYICRTNIIPFDKMYQTEDFLANSALYALNQALWLFERFNFNTSPREVLSKTQRDYLQKKR